jgi:nucleoside-diphosphate-sugar epimerase
LSDTGDRGGKLAVAVYGAGGAVGRDLVQLLIADGEIDAILALDEVPASGSTGGKLTYRQISEGAPFDAALKDARVNLAVYLAPSACGSHENSLGQDDTATLKRFLAACELVDVEGLVILSGANIYGARPDNPSFFAEGAPLKCAGFAPGELDLARERLAIEFARRRPQAAVAVCRLAHVIGPGTRGLMSRFLEGSKLSTLDGFDPPVQFVHAEDASRVALKLLKAGRNGVYNVAADDYTTFMQLGRTFKKPLVRVSPTMAKLRSWVGSLVGGIPTPYMPLLQYPLLLTNRKLKRDTQYQFRYGSEQALTHHAKRAAPTEPQAV